MSTVPTHDTPGAPRRTTLDRPHVVVVGSGFGGLFAAQGLRKADVDVTLVSRTTHHLFQPLLYQVATGILSEGDIAPSTREILNDQQNATVLLGDVTAIDLAARTITSQVLDRKSTTTYDHLVVAAGAGQSYFGNDQFARFAPGMKSIDDALELRGRIFGAFEMAELAWDAAEEERLLTFVVVGAGPTGVEMAGQIAELSRQTLRRDFRRIDPTQGQGRPRRRGPAGAPRLRGGARREGAPQAHADGRGHPARHDGHRRRPLRHRGQGQGRDDAADRGPGQGVGGGGAGQRARLAAG